MATLTKEDLDILKAPFKATEHEFLRSFVYITEFAIVTRIEKVDPAWEFEITALDSRPAMGEKDQVQVTCTAALTINSVTRHGVGQAKAYETKSYPDKETGETKPTEEANEAEKSAATDALKRAARLFGIGRYLLVLPKDIKGKQIIKNEKQLGVWIEKGLAAKAKAEAKEEGLQNAVDSGVIYDGEQIEYEGMLIGDPALPAIDEDHDEYDYQDYPDKPIPTERYTTPTNLVVTKIGENDKQRMVIEGCTFWSREAFRLLSYDKAIIEDLGKIDVTKLPDTVTVVYIQEGNFKTPVRIQRNSTNATVDVTKKPVLLAAEGQ